ncbi:ArsR/SmtB family transcription factor [Tenggerimyces flavus]|uniref:ArsR/SmtB family transcription factor n=1 Tax=Tenggerimyces flavus TaxID=1708749 RepID=A0ABV7YEE8_9ACTN|nr:winged helix-turn-helix domain-containing protein [Tenggerimyces flavus]MBM7784276.1 DNA-binding transcriptional ArsR family regulator [Tenggerimyces flavus]
MIADSDLAGLATLLADESRARMCMRLMDGRAWTSGELARAADIAPSTASEHLGRLVQGGLAVVVPQGRHRYYRLAGPEVAFALEALLTIAPPRPVRNLREASRGRATAAARTCYDHLAGQAGVALTSAFHVLGYLDEEALTPVGARAFTEFGVDVEALRQRRRVLVRHCVDWTERRPHLAGALGAAITAELFDRGWLVRIGTGRAVQVTPPGRQGLWTTFGWEAQVA